MPKVTLPDLDNRYLQAYRDMLDGLPVARAAEALGVSITTAKAIRTGKQARIYRLLAKGAGPVRTWF